MKTSDTTTAADRKAAFYAAETAIGAARTALQEAGSEQLPVAEALLHLVTREHARLFPPPGVKRVIKGTRKTTGPRGGCL